MRCYGPSCRPDTTPTNLRDVAQEWPLNTHGLLPLRLATFRPDIVHATSHIGPLWGPGKLVITVHDLIFMHRPADYNPLWLAVTRATLPRVLARASAIIADSHTTAGDITHFLNVPARKLHVVYPGIDPVPPASSRDEVLPGILSKPSLRRGERYIICIGPWVRRKNLTVVLRAFELVACEEQDLHLLITGTGAAGMKGASPEELASRLPGPVRKRVHCMGFIPRQELYSLLSGAALLAYPSRIEGFGLPPLEAMSMGVPVVTSEAPVLLEIAGGAALFAPVDDPQAWAQAFRRVLREPELARQLRQLGLARSNLFSWERCTKETVSVYRQLGIRNYQKRNLT